jgi:hypothetical protein
MGNLNATQRERVLEIVPRCTASLGMPFAAALIYEVWLDAKKGRNTAVKRSLVGMSLIDLCASFGWFLSSWAVPRGTYPTASGNRASCSFQGFLLQLAVGAPLYNSSLALYYLLMIKYRWTDVMLRRIEYYVHGFILSFSVGTAILLLPLHQYNEFGSICWVTGNPQECDHSNWKPNPDVPCHRGNHAWIYALSLFYVPLYTCMVICLACMLSIHLEVRNTVSRLNRYSVADTTVNRVHLADSANIVAQQALLYTLCFAVTWIPSTFSSVAGWFNYYHYVISLLAVITEPMQAFWNYLVFVRNRPNTRARIRNTLRRYSALIYHSHPLTDEPSESSRPRGFFVSGHLRRETKSNGRDQTPNESPVFAADLQDDSSIQEQVESALDIASGSGATSRVGNGPA